MRTTCAQCNMSDFAVAKTWPYENYTIRQLKCQNCQAHVFSREYIMDKPEYKWRTETTEKGTTRTYIFYVDPAKVVDKS